MIRSMTGFGRGEEADGKRNITCEIKSVNHRYSDISVRMSRRYSFCEDAIKKEVKENVKRGKIDVSILVESVTESDVSISLNQMVADQYVDNLNVLKERYGFSDVITLDTLAQLPEVMRQIPDASDEDEIRRSIVSAVNKALKALNDMRQVEGEKLAEDLRMRGGIIKGLVDEIEEKSKDVPAQYKEKLTERIKELLDGSVEIPEEKIAVEAAIFADKCNITEELIRLKSHMDQLEMILSEDADAHGKKLDFLVQEMNREANTIGSKANDIEITNLMLKVKAEVEKIREQVQNIE